MGRHLVKKWRFYAAAYIALAAMGTAMFMSLDAPYFEDPAGGMADRSVFFTALSCPAEYLAAISSAKDRSFSPLRHSSARMTTPLSSFSAGAGLLYAALRLFTKAAAYNIKNTILLKLRV